MRFVVGLLLGWMVLSAAAFAVDQASSSAPHDRATELNNLGVKAAQAGRFEEVVAWLRQAAALAPSDATARKNLSGVLTDWAPRLEQQGHPHEAVTALQEAVQVDQSNGEAWVRLGDLFYVRASRIPEAIAAWRQAQGRVADAAWRSVAERISQAQRDQLIERHFAARSTPHFAIRFDASQTIDLNALAQTLETAYAGLTGIFGAAPPTITVLVYSNEDLHRAYYQRDWAIGFYDGRLRLRADDLAAPYVSDLIAHELTHAFLQEVYGRGLPIWAHEGFAQCQEQMRRVSPEQARLEQRVAERTQWIPMQWLDRHFAQPSGQADVAAAYVQAKAVVKELIGRYGMARWLQFLEALWKGSAVEAAYDQAFAPSTWARADRGIFN